MPPGGIPGGCAAAARRTGIPYTCYTHGCYEPWAWKHNYWKKRVYWELIEKRVMAGAAGIVVCNEGETAQLRLGGAHPYRRIPWGVEIPNPTRRLPENGWRSVFPR